MPVIAVGLNHRSAPLPLLERVAISPEDLGKALASLSLRDNLSEVVVVSTCMRTEVYAVAERFHGAVSDIVEFLATRAGIEHDEVSGRSYSFHDIACVSHLFRVAAGLDSAVLGEGEVLGQVREAWERSMREGTAGPTLNALFRHATEVGKRSRAETAIARGITSVPQAGVVLASQALGETSDTSVLVVGAGTIGSVVATTVAAGWSPRRIVVASRAAESAEALCSRLADEGYPGALPTTLDALAAHIAAADVVFSATTSSEPVITLHDLPEPSRRPRVVIDLAVPRDVDPAIATETGVALYDMESIGRFVEAQMAGRAGEIDHVAEIIEEEVARYSEAATARHAAPLISALRRRAEDIRAVELDRHSRRLSSLDDSERATIESLTRSLIAKLLHEPTVRLKSAAGTPRGERLSESLRDLFDL